MCILSIALALLVETTLAAGSAAVTDIEYDSDGNLAGLTGPANRGGQRYRLGYTYDPETRTHVTGVVDSFGGRRTDIRNPDTGHLHVDYDAAGNVTRRVTANLRATGGAIEYHYDFTHLVAIDYPTHDENDVQYTWGGSDARAGNRVGRITRINDAAGSVTRTYGPLGEVVREDRTIDGPRGGSAPATYTTRTSYDTWGRVRQIVYPDTEVLTYGYDSGGRVRHVEGTKLGERFVYVERFVTIPAFSGNYFPIVSRGGLDLVGPSRQILALARQQGARTLTFRGVFVNRRLAERFGRQVGDSFEVTVEASRDGLITAARRLQ